MVKRTNSSNEEDVSLDPVTKKFVKKRKEGGKIKASQVELLSGGDEEVEDENIKEGEGVVEEVEEVEEKGEAEQIRELLDGGYDAKQIIKEFGFHRDTVRQQVKKRVPPEAESKEEERLPAVLKRAEIITPEAIMQEYLVEDGVEGRGMIKGMMLLRAAQRMVMDDVEIMKGMAEADSKKLAPILKLMAETRKEQDAAAERAKASNEEIATRAAEDALAGAIQYLSERPERKVDVATLSNPMAGIFARALEPVMTQAITKMLGAFGMGGGQPAPIGAQVQPQTIEQPQQATLNLPSTWTIKERANEANKKPEEEEVE